MNLFIHALWCGYYEGNGQSKRVQEKAGFQYDHMTENVFVPLMDEYRNTYFTKMDNPIITP